MDFKLRDKKSSTSFPLDKLEITIVNHGFLCETSVLMVYENSTDSDAEGELGNSESFRLIGD